MKVTTLVVINFWKKFGQTFSKLWFGSIRPNPNFGRPGRPNFGQHRCPNFGRPDRPNPDRSGLAFGRPLRRRRYMDPKVDPNLGQLWVEFSTRVWLSLRSSFRPQTLPKLDPKVDRPDPEKCQTLRFRNLKFGRSKKKWPYFRGRKVTIKVAAFLVTFLDGENELKVARLTTPDGSVLIYILLIKLSTFRPPPTRPTGSVWGWFPGRETSSLPLFSTSKSAQTLTTFSTRKSALFRPRNCSSLDVKLGSVRGRKSRLWEARNRRSGEQSKRAARAPRVLVPGWEGETGLPGTRETMVSRDPGSRETVVSRPTRPTRPTPSKTLVFRFGGKPALPSVDRELSRKLTRFPV